MRWKAHVKAKYDFLYQWCLTDAEKKQVEGFSEISVHEPTVTEWESFFKQVCVKAMKNPDKRILFLQFYSGHGMTFAGEQVLLSNEFDEKNEWYKMINVESLVRNSAEFCPNVYFLPVFICDRLKHMKINNENRNEAQHRGISMAKMEKEKAQALGKEVKEEAPVKEEKKPEADADADDEKPVAVLASDGTKMTNFCFLYCCKPGATISKDSKVMYSLTTHLASIQDQCIIPGTFDNAIVPGCYFETVASNLGQSLNLVHQANNVGQMTCLYIETKKRTPDRNRQKAEALSFCKQVL
jgi:hypothetical protein